VLFITGYTSLNNLLCCLEHTALVYVAYHVVQNKLHYFGQLAVLFRKCVLFATHDTALISVVVDSTLYASISSIKQQAGSYFRLPAQCIEICILLGFYTV
jgi:hypothetical protein